MHDSKKIRNLLFSAALGSTMALSLNGVKSHADTTSFKPYTPVAYDISEFQGQLNDQQVINLKNEVKFVVLRIQDGQYHDQQVNNDIRLMEKYGISYGVYSYSRYVNPQQAKEEAKRLHSFAPKAKFYANDFEISFTENSDASAVAWAKEMKKLTRQPVILYSSQSTLDQFQQSTINSYDAVWLANYSKYMPNPSYNYDLWQYTDKYQSQALGQTLDADTIPVGGKKLAFWTTEKKAHGKRRVVAKTGTARHIKRKSQRTVLHKANKKQVIKKTSAKKAKKLKYKPLSNKKQHNTKKAFKRHYHIKKYATGNIVRASYAYNYNATVKKVNHKKHYKKAGKKHRKYRYRLNNATQQKLVKHHLKKHSKHTYKFSKKAKKKLARKHLKQKHVKKYNYQIKRSLKHKKSHRKYAYKSMNVQHHNKAKKHYKYKLKKSHHKHAKKYVYRAS